MPSIDMPLDELRKYKPALTRQHDFAAFWKKGLESLRREPVSVNLSVKPLPFKGIDVYELNYIGAGGALITGELLAPQGAAKAPGVVVYHGYSGARNPAHTVVHWTAMGAVVLSVDVRGQRGGASDNAAYPGPRSPGFMTAGLEDPKTYYYRNVYLDSVRALDVLAGRDEVDPAKLAVTGISQGGGLSLAAAALDERVALCMSEVPFLCDFPRAASITGEAPYKEISNYLRRGCQEEIARTFQTLSYFDNVNLAGMIRARTIISVGLWDAICPPSGIFAAYNHLACRKQIEVYPYMGHESNTAFTELCMREMAREFGL
jgi:cephalosporin-C deacetylase